MSAATPGSHLLNAALYAEGKGAERKGRRAMECPLNQASGDAEAQTSDNIMERMPINLIDHNTKNGLYQDLLVRAGKGRNTHSV